MTAAPNHVLQRMRRDDTARPVRMASGVYEGFAARAVGHRCRGPSTRPVRRVTELGSLAAASRRLT